jgi:hypothetical protein
MEEQAQRAPADQRISDRIGEAAARWDAFELHLEPGFQGPDQRQRLGLPHALALLDRLASDCRLDRIELGDALERLRRDRRTGRLVHLI